MEEKNENKISIIKKFNSHDQKNYEYLFKLALVGDSGIGKTSILLRFSDDIYRQDTISTIGVDFRIVSISLPNNTFAKMQIWDTCGSERFKSLTTTFLKSCPAFILVFDITNIKSFKSLSNWITIINDSSSPKMLCLIGNKCDLESQRQVTKEEALEFSKKNGLKYMETSAKTNENIEEVFIHISEILYKEVYKNNTDKTNSSKTFDLGGFKSLHEINEKNDEKGGCC